MLAVLFILFCSLVDSSAILSEGCKTGTKGECDHHTHDQGSCSFAVKDNCSLGSELPSSMASMMCKSLLRIMGRTTMDYKLPTVACYDEGQTKKQTDEL